jgi:hypothetical protein
MQEFATCPVNRRAPHKLRILYMWAGLALVIHSACHVLPAQQLSLASALPDAPAPQQTAPQQTTPQQILVTPIKAIYEHRDPQTKRILYIFPNFRAISAETHLPPQSVNEKFITASEDSLDYSAFVLPALLAVELELTNTTPEFGHGGVGYGRYVWHAALDQANQIYFVEFIVPSITREDTRYYTLGPGGGGKLKRIGYAISRTVIARDLDGHDTFNFGEILGAGAAAGVSNLYYPTHERTFGNTAGKWGGKVGGDAITFILREYWPDINHFLFHGHQPLATH